MQSRGSADWFEERAKGPRAESRGWLTKNQPVSAEGTVFRTGADTGYPADIFQEEFIEEIYLPISSLKLAVELPSWYYYSYSEFSPPLFTQTTGVNRQPGRRL